jgi:hypothetical protein
MDEESTTVAEVSYSRMHSCSLSEFEGLLEASALTVH